MLRYFSMISLLVFGSAASAETLAEHLGRSGSHASLTLEIPYSVLAELVNARLESRYSGSKDNPTSALRKDVLNWQFTPSPVTVLQHTNGLGVVMRGAAQGRVQIKGELGFVPVSVSADLAAHAEVELQPVLNSDWSITPNATGRATLNEANVYGASVRSLLQSDLDRTFHDALNGAFTEISTPGYLKEELKDFWLSICNTAGSNENLQVVPVSVATTQPVALADALRITVIISGQVQYSVGAPAECPAMPDTLVLLD